MSTDIVLDEIAHADEHAGDGHAHPTDAMFVRTAAILAAITALEVAWSYIHWSDGFVGQALEIGGLLIMMTVKFITVANVFMHLKFDKKLLSGLFYGGVVLAIAVYVAALSTFEFFTGSNPPYVR